jgi:prepilin-type processing-associated H-X9-DG protein
VKGAERVPVFFDCACPYFAAVGDNLGAPPACEDSADFSRCQVYHVCINRHDGGINMVFLDGSVRKVGLKELWTLKWFPQYDTANRWTKAGGVRPEDWPQWMRGFKDY